MSLKAATYAGGDVLKERARQDDKWGEQNHDPFVWLAVLNEEVGEYAKAALETRLRWERTVRLPYNPKTEEYVGGVKDLREEAVQVAAVALAMVEAIDRGKWRWSGNPIASEDR